MNVVRKALAAVATAALCTTLAAVAWAGEPEEPVATQPTGTITIENALEGQTYKIYRILDLESYEADVAYSYVPRVGTDAKAEFWSEWVAKQTGYLTVSADGYVTWVEGANEADFAIAALAAAQAQEDATKNEVDTAKRFAADDEITVPVDSTDNDDVASITFEGLPLGYYLVDSSVGALCSLDTTDSAAQIEEKNQLPQLEKEVQEDSTNDWGTSNDAQVGDTVYFRATIAVEAGAQNYVFHDTMSDGLTFNGGVEVFLDAKGATETVQLKPSTDYTLTTTGLEDGCTFEVRFVESLYSKLEAGDEIAITYSATLNEDAVIADVGNPNQSELTYGDGQKIESDTTTYAWQCSVLKYTGENKTPLAGAEFALSTSADPADTSAYLQYAAADDGAPYTVSTSGQVTTITTNSTGTFAIAGLDSGTYYLHEIAAPAGYNKLTAPVEVKIAGKDANGDVVVNAVEVENKTGSVLPSTGGMGTTVVYVLGAVLALGAGVVLVTKIRMGNK